MKHLMLLIMLLGSALGLMACGQEVTTTQSSAKISATPKTPNPQTPNPQTLEDIDFSSYSEDLAKFVGLQNGEPKWAAVDKMRLYFAPEDGETILHTKTSTFDRPDGSVMIYTVSGLIDDSVKAQEIFMIFSGEDAQSLGAYGLKQKCQRGENTNEWTTQLCS